MTATFRRQMDATRFISTASSNECSPCYRGSRNCDRQLPFDTVNRLEAYRPKAENSDGQQRLLCQDIGGVGI